MPSCLPSNYSAQRKQGTWDGGVVAGDKDERILSQYLKFLLCGFKYEENKSIYFNVRGLTFEVFEFILLRLGY